jgi:O-antigen/teichoic acid export membrane protein
MRRSSPGLNVVFAYAGIAIPAAVGLLFVPFLIRNLGAPRFGLLSLLLSISAFFASFDFGVGTALSRYVSRLSVRPSSTPRARRLIESMLLVQTAIGIAVGLVLLVFFKVAWQARSMDAAVGGDELDLAVDALALAIPFALLSGAARSALEGLSRFALANALRSPASAATFGVPILVSFFSARLDTMMAWLFLARVVFAMAFLASLRLSLGRERLRVTPRYVLRAGRLLLSYGGWVMVGAFAGGLITMGVIDRFLVGRLLGAGSIIQYSLPSDVVIRCLLAPAAITTVLLPILARAAAEVRPMGPSVRSATSMLIGQVGSISLLLTLNADRLLGLLAKGHVDATSVSILQAMAFGFFVHATAHVPYAALLALGRPRAAAIRHVIELPFYLLLSWALLRGDALALMGVLWAAWAVCDLVLLAVLLRAASPDLRLRLILANPRLLVWCALLIGATVVGRMGLPRLSLDAVSACGLAYWLLQVLKLVRRRDVVLFTAT